MTKRKPFEHIVAEHGATVLRVARAVVGPDDAEDAWSETFLAALKAYPTLPADANVQAWLVTIAHRKAIDVIRAQRRRALALDAMADQPSTIASAGPYEGDALSALEGLPDRQRQAIAYHVLAGLPYWKVAEIMGGTPAAARRAASDGIAALRRTLADRRQPQGGVR